MKNNKYQEALRKIQIGLGFKLNEVEYENAFKTIKELVDKEAKEEKGICKECFVPVLRWDLIGDETEFCSSCGHELDWSDEK